MARTYNEAKRSTIMSVEAMREQQNVEALRRSVSLTQWTIEETAQYVGRKGHENRDLAIDLLREKGNDSPTSRQISSQMKSIQRWIANERGTGAQKAKPSAAARDLLNRVGRNNELAKNGFSVKLKGEIAVNGYKRRRTAAVDLEGDRARSFLENPNWGDLGKAYLNDSDSLYGFDDDLQVSIIAE